MEISIWQILITAVTGPILAIGVKEYFDFLKRKQELSLAVTKLTLERKLHLAEQAINVWKGQEALLSIVVELLDRSYDNIQLLRGEEFQKLFTKYGNDLDEVGKKSWEVTNAIDLYFDIKVTATDYNPYKALSEFVSSVQNNILELQVLNNSFLGSVDSDERQYWQSQIDNKINEVREHLKQLANVFRDGIMQLNQAIDLVKKQVNKQYLSA